MARASKYLPLLLVICSGLLLGSGRAAAAKATDTTGGITLSPFLQQISIAPDDPGKSFPLTVTNHTASLQELKLSVQDFGSLNDTGGILLKGSTKYTQKYGLTSWMTLESDTVTLSPNESRAVNVTINNRSSLQPGGHYGAVVASVNSLEDQTNNKVVVNQQILSLMLVNKVGGEHYDLKLTGARQNGNWLHLPNTVRLRFQNPGNVHVVPRGVVSLKNPAGKVLARGMINTESAYILPESFRELYVPLTTVDKTLSLPGIYHIQVDYRYDGLTKTATKRYAVRYINLKLYALLVIIVLAGAWLYVRHRRKKSTATPV